ncbi:hypothetical protein DPMN_119939 [Dreissena polymorpha]|uniref:Uncharacterized protein n=1 Tax=Dreissena polymorpha TaxID=45954 RepID=A0A9D4GK42_DREPO|nr:hypothetical protein DPMN_119939 [Dreissena polymorpha]
MCGDVELNTGPPKTSTDRKRVSPIGQGACGGPSDMDPLPCKNPRGRVGRASTRGQPEMDTARRQSTTYDGPDTRKRRISSYTNIA